MCSAIRAIVILGASVPFAFSQNGVNKSDPNDDPIVTLSQPSSAQSKFQASHPTSTPLPASQGTLLFHNADGTRTAVLGPVTHQDPTTGAWQPNAPVLSTTKNGWRVDGTANSLFIRANGNSGHTITQTFSDPTSKHDSTLTFGTPPITYDKGLGFHFAMSGLTWTLNIGQSGGFAFASTVAARRGKSTYSFDVSSSENLTTDANGNLIGDNHVALSRAVMFPRTGKPVACAPWTWTKKDGASFTCDDSGFKDSQLPYRIDPYSQTVTDGGTYNIDAWGGPHWDDSCQCVESDGNIPTDNADVWLNTSGLIPSGGTYVRSECGFNVVSSNLWGADSVACDIPNGFNNSGTTHVSVGIFVTYVPNGDTYSSSATVDSVSLTVTYTLPAETVSTPTTPTGPTNGNSGTSYTFSTGGSTSSLGNSVQYQFNWGDSTNSGWLATGTTSASHTWSSGGTFQVTAQARSAANNSILSGVSGSHAFAIPAPQTITFNSLPNKALGSAPFAVSATASSGLAVSFNSQDTTSVCTMSNATVTLAATGLCTIQATQAGNANWASATPVTQSFTVLPPPSLSISKSHIGTFTQGQNGATYSVVVSNGAAAGPTSGTVTVTEAVPTGLTLVSMSGTGWTCPGGNTCTRGDALAAASSYPAITVTVNVAGNASSPQVNSVTVSGGNSASATATDSTTIGLPPPPSLSISKSHTGSFTQGQGGATYSIAVSNAAGVQSTSGTVTVTEAVPTGLTLVSMSGTGWTCPAGNSCTRSDALAAGASYPAITVTVNVASNAAVSVTNSATVSGGGDANSHTATDPTTVNSLIPPGAIAYWSADNTTVDAIGGNNGTLVNGATYAPGAFNQAFSFNGVNSYVQLAGYTNIFGSRSISLWAYPLSQPGSSGMPLVTDGYINAADFFGISNNRPYLDNWSGNVYYSTSSVTPYTWNHLALVYNGSSIIFYINGVATNTVTGSLHNYPLGSYQIGGNTAYGSTTQGSFNGQLDEIRIYTRALTAAEVQALATPPVPPAPASLSVTKSHTGNFYQTQSAATYSVTVSNGAAAGPTNGIVTVTESVPAGLTLVSMAGSGWTCPGGNTCTRSDALAAGASYPAITVTVNVAANATSPQVNSVTVSAGNSASATATDSTTIGPPPPPSLSIAKSHSGTFNQGQNGATYSVSVSNATSVQSTSGTVTVTDTLPTGLTLVSMSGTGWTCPGGNTCTRSDALAAGASYPAITVTVNVAANAPASLVNQVSVSGGGSVTANATDPTTVIGVVTIPSPTSLPAGTAAAAYPATTIPAAGGSGTYTWSATGLPNGLSIGTTNGTISGTPSTSNGSPFNVQVSATDGNGVTGSRSYSLTVSPAPAIIFTIAPLPAQNPSGSNTQIVQYGAPMTYTILPPAGYIGSIRLLNFGVSCIANFPVYGVLATGTTNADGSLSLTITEDMSIGYPGFLSSPCAQNSPNVGKIDLNLTINAFGENPTVAVQTFPPMPLEIRTTTPAISLAVSLSSKTTTTATYWATVSTTSSVGTINLGLQSGSCARLLGTAPALTSAGTTKIPLLTSGCAPGTNTTVTFTAGNASVQADPQTVPLQTLPNAAVMANPVPGATIPGGLTSFSWSTVTGATYSLAVGRSPGASDIYSLVTTSPSATATLPNSGSVYATVGTLVGGVWQYQQCAYSVNPNPGTAPLVVTGSTSVRVTKNGQKMRRVYYFSGGDPTTITRASSSINGVSATLVGVSPNTATIEFQADSTVQSGLQGAVSVQTPTGSFVAGSEFPFDGASVRVEPTPQRVGQAVEITGDYVGSAGEIDITTPNGTTDIFYYSGAGGHYGLSYTVGQVGHYTAAFWVTEFEGEDSPEPEFPIPSAQEPFDGLPQISVNVPKTVVGADSNFTVTATVTNGQGYKLKWTDTGGLISSNTQTANCPADLDESGKATCSLTAGSNGGKGTITVTVQDGTNSQPASTAQLIVVKIVSISMAVPNNLGTDTTTKDSTASIPSDALQWPTCESSYDNCPAGETIDLWKKPKPAVLLRGSIGGVKLTATTVPDWNSDQTVSDAFQNGTIRFRIFRDSKDAGSGTGVPSLQAQDKGTVTLNLDQTGTFQILAYVDNNASSDWDPGETGITLPVIFVEATLPSEGLNSSVPHTTNILCFNSARNGNPLVQLFSGGNTQDPQEAAVVLSVEVDLLGGGPHGRQGVDQVFSGWVQNATAKPAVAATYRDPLQNAHTVSQVWPQNRDFATGSDKDIDATNVPMFLKDDPAPKPYPLPDVPPLLLDSGRGTKPDEPKVGTGGDSSTLRRNWHSSVSASGLGLKYDSVAIDAPGTPFFPVHPSYPNSRLQRIDYALSFVGYLVLWTNASGNSAPGDVFDHLYSVIYEQPWSISASCTVDASGTPSLGAHSVTLPSGTKHLPLVSVKALNIILSPPTFLDLITWDARN